VRKFIRVKAKLDSGEIRYLAADPNVPYWWTAVSVENKKEAHEFNNKREVYGALVRLGGQWLDRGRIVHVITRLKVSNESR